MTFVSLARVRGPGPAVGLVLLGLFVTALAPGCRSAPERNPLPREFADEARIPGMSGIRAWGDEAPPQMQRWLELDEAQLLEGYSGIMGQRHAYLAISGGGQNGAFGAGLLVGWTVAGNRPEFTTVTGISTGALIAPFAFLGPEHDGTLEELYTSYSTADLVDERSWFAVLTGDAMTSTAPLQRLVESTYDRDLLEAVAAEGRRGRRLLVATTNIDAGRSVIWNMTAIAGSGHPRALQLFQQVIMASTAIPVAFPPVLIDVEAGGEHYDEMHVDGGATAQVFWYPIDVDWTQVLERLNVPGTPRVYVIRNGFLRTRWRTIERSLASIAGRTFDTLIDTQAVGDLYRIFVAAERDGIDYHMAHIPEGFEYESQEVFDREYMRRLFRLGYDMAKGGYPWATSPDGVEPEAGELSD